MKKGFGPLVLIIVIAVILVVEIIVVGTVFKKENLEHRQLLEASLISKSDKVETYVRSLMRATDLSSLQGLDAFGTGQIVLPYESDSEYSEYHLTYNMPYWQIYDTILIPPKEVLLNKVKQKTAWVASCYLENYMDSYESFSQEVTVDGGKPILTVDSIKDDEIIVMLSGGLGDLSATLSGEFGWGGKKSEINMRRSFRPYSKIDTNFKKVVEKAESIVYDDLLGQLIRNEIYSHDMNELGEVRTQLDNLAADQSNTPIKVILKIPKDSDYFPGSTTAAAIINVTIYDESADYTFYDFPTDKVTTRHLGVNFLAKVGHTGLIGDGDEVEAQTLTRECSSGLGIISQKDVCSFFSDTPACIPDDCQDTDDKDYTTVGTCTDFTGSYDDLCFDSDKDGVSELFEYFCHSSNICYYEYYDCPSGCESGACKIGCSASNPCPSDVCWYEVCMNPGEAASYCQRENEPTTKDCGTKSRECSSSNCWCSGDDWICETDTDKTCNRKCDGVGSCGDCIPPECDTVDMGCCGDSDCPSGQACRVSTHTCENVACYGPGDCGNAPSVCQYYTCENAGTLSANCQLNDYSDGYIPPGDGCGIDTTSCPDKCEGGYEYRNPTNNPETCTRTCDGSGSCKVSCTPPACDYQTIQGCNFGCKSGTDRCEYGYDCPSTTCGYCRPCQLGSCGWPCCDNECTAGGCIDEDDYNAGNYPTCTWYNKWYNPLQCGLVCCQQSNTCTAASCSYSDLCTYV